jgi:hypothetical protein
MLIESMHCLHDVTVRAHKRPSLQGWVLILQDHHCSANFFFKSQHKAKISMKKRVQNQKFGCRSAMKAGKHEAHEKGTTCFAVLGLLDPRGPPVVWHRRKERRKKRVGGGSIERII